MMGSSALLDPIRDAFGLPSIVATAVISIRRGTAVAPPAEGVSTR